MTATATPTAPPEAADTPRDAAPRRWRLAILLLVTLVAVGLLLRPGGQPAHTWVPPDAAARGTYLLDDGRHLTLWGPEMFPRYELDGRVTMLMAEDADRYMAMDGAETLTVQRAATGDVTGLRLESPHASYTAEPVLLHTEREVRFSSTGADLSGTLLVPQGDGPHPAVIIVHGSEVTADRDNYRLLGSHFARRGVAALIYDKRGVGESTGSFAHATVDDLSDDAFAAVSAVAAQPDIDPDRVGLLGFSQGGWVVAQAAQTSDAVAFVAAYSPSGFSPGDQQAWLHGSMLAARGFDRAGMVVADRVSRMQYSSLDLVDAGLMPRIPQVPGFWFHALDLRTDSTALWASVHQPVLLAWGATDCQVPAHDSMTLLGDALSRGGNPDVTLAVFPDADHSFTLVEPCGHETGMAHHGSMQYVPGYFDLGPDWIHTLTDTRRSAPDVPVADRPDTTVLGWHLDPPDPAPWYGTIPAQLATLMVLLGAFGLATARWLVALLRRKTAGRVSHLAGATGLTGVLAILTGFAAFTEIGMLGDTHAAPLVGPGTVDGLSLLMTIARLLVSVAAGLGVAASAGVGRPRSSTRWVLAMGTALLVAWAAYWKLLPFA